MSFDIRMRNSITNEGLQDNFPDKDTLTDFLIAQLILWRLDRGRLPNTFQIQITEVP